MSTIGTWLCGRPPLSNLNKMTLMFLTLILQYLNKLREGKIRDFTSPQAFHAVKVERFKDEGIKSLAKGCGKFPMPIFALVGNFAIETCELTDTPPPAISAFLFSRKRLVERSEFVQRLLQRLRVVYLLTRAQCQICVFHAEVCPNVFTRCWQRFGVLKIRRDTKPIGIAGIALEGDVFDVTVKLAMFEKGIRYRIAFPFTRVPFSQGEHDTIVFYLPTRLFQRERLELMAFLNLGSTAKLLEKTHICSVNTSQFFLHGLTRQRFPMWMCRAFQRREMCGHSVIVRIRQSVFIPLTLPLMEVFMHLPHIVKQVAKPYQIGLIVYFILIGFHGISGIRRLSRFSGRQAHYQAVMLKLLANLILLIIPQLYYNCQVYFSHKPNTRLHPLPEGRGLDGKIDNDNREN